VKNQSSYYVYGSDDPTKKLITESSIGISSVDVLTEGKYNFFSKEGENMILLGLADVEEFELSENIKYGDKFKIDLDTTG
jgi:uncharacterized protein YaiE (UPF0345 family)